MSQNHLSFLEKTMMEAHDARYITDHDFSRTVPIPTLGVLTTDFNITEEQKEALYQSGKEAATQFFQTWDFESYKQKFRKKSENSRSFKVWKK